LIVNLTKFGYACIATLGIKVVPSKLEDVIKYVKTIDGVDFCGQTIGSYNLIIFLFLKDIEQLKKIIETIKIEPSVIEVNTSIWTSIEKALARPKNISLERVMEARSKRTI
jgi:nitrate reductase NapAB chaperone NapD